MAIKKLAPVSPRIRMCAVRCRDRLVRSTSTSSACRMSGTATTWFEISEHEVVLDNQDLEHAQSSSLRSDRNSERSGLPGDSRSGLPRDARPQHLNDGDERGIAAL